MKYKIAPILSNNKTKDFDFKSSSNDYKHELAIFSTPGYSWSSKQGFHADKDNKEYKLIKTFSKAQDDSMFCSLDMSFEEHENMKKLYYLMTQY